MEQSERRSFIQEAADGQLKCSGCSVRCFGKKVSSNKQKTNKITALFEHLSVQGFRRVCYLEWQFYQSAPMHIETFFVSYFTFKRDAILTDVFKAALTFMTNFRPSTASKYSGQSAG